MNFYTCGYYITAPVPRPDYISLACDQILSASACICDHHPQLDGPFWGRKKEDKAYRQALDLPEEDYARMKERIADLFGRGRLDTDSRFLSLSDAREFYQEFLRNLPGLKILSLAVWEKSRQAVLDEIGQDCGQVSEELIIAGHILGYELLGWDVSSFHSYLCNELEKDILSQYPLAVSELGLIQNSYRQAAEFCQHIQGKGEPVLWIPFVMWEHSLAGDDC